MGKADWSIKKFRFGLSSLKRPQKQKFMRNLGSVRFRFP